MSPWLFVYELGGEEVDVRVLGKAAGVQSVWGGGIGGESFTVC